MLLFTGLSHIDDGGRSYTPLQVVPAGTCALTRSCRAERPRKAPEARQMSTTTQLAWLLLFYLNESTRCRGRFL
jgi:hypothetical protein